MTETLELYLAGEHTTGTGSDVHPLVSPVTGEHVADVPLASPDDIDRAVAAAGEAQTALAGMTAFERAALCHRIADLIDENAAEIARVQTLEQGKPYRAESLPEVEEAAQMFRDAGEDVKRLKGDVVPSSDPAKRILVLHRPVGVWTAITPWNFPFMIPCEYLAPGLAAGNAVVCKPPAHTPWSLLLLGRILDEAGVPTGAVSIIPGEAEIGEALVTHPGIHAIGFTGSSATGERIVSIAGLKRTLMEMSGNGPLIVLDDADVEAAAQAAVSGATYGAGQVCCATERVIAHRSVREPFLEAVVAAAESVVLGDPFDEATTMGPLNNAATAEKVDRHLADARTRGCRVVRGGRATGFPTDLYYDVTIVDAVPPDALIAREESFGPVVPVIEAGSDEEALAVANDDPLGLSAAVWTSDVGRAFWFADRLRNGNVIVNDSVDFWDALEPFGGGAGTRSGWGRIGGDYTVRDMTDLRTVVLDVGLRRRGA